VVVSDISLDPRFSASQSLIESEVRAILAAPMIVSDEVIGMIALASESSADAMRWNENVEFLCICASMIGPFLQNMELQFELEETQREVLLAMGAISETRSQETANHVRRVAEYSGRLAELAGLSQDKVELLKLASPMHDIGKVGIPDHILSKPGELTADEWAIMKTHATLGYELLRTSSRPILKAAAVIAHEHHEKWDGSGYPRGLAGKDIHIFGRITAVADVFDALASERAYKPAWAITKIIDFFRRSSGTHFEPVLVGLFLENIGEFHSIFRSLAD